MVLPIFWWRLVIPSTSRQIIQSDFFLFVIFWDEGRDGLLRIWNISMSKWSCDPAFNCIYVYITLYHVWFLHGVSPRRQELRCQLNEGIYFIPPTPRAWKSQRHSRLLSAQPVVVIIRHASKGKGSNCGRKLMTHPWAIHILVHYRSVCGVGRWRS
jgi:hypothetical protein